MRSRCGSAARSVYMTPNDQVVAAVDAAAEALGRLDAAVANAGIAAGGPLRLQSLRSWERVIEINLLVKRTSRIAHAPTLTASRSP